MKTLKASGPEVSIVIPVYNEAENIKALVKRLNSLATKLPSKTEIIFVDDGSRDATVKLLQKEKLKYKKKIIQLSRNFGHQAALLAGLSSARGDIVVTMDGDLQHPPEFILEMLKHHQRGVDIILTKRLDGDETSGFKRLTARGFYSVMNVLAEMPIHYSASDFRSMNRRAVDSLLDLPERRKYLRGMVEWIGFTSMVLPFRVEARHKGQSKYNMGKMLNLALHGITSFSVVPLYFSALGSVILFVLAFLYALYVLYIRFVAGGAISGWASVLFINLLIGGLTLLTLALIGIYIAAIYIEVKQRPIYITKAEYDQKKS